MNRRNAFFEITTLLTVLGLSALAIWGLLIERTGYTYFAVAAIGLGLIAFTILRFKLNPDHLRAKQSEQILDLANQTQTFLGDGLSRKSAQAVCNILAPAIDASAVAVTDTETILGFAGEGEDHHSVGGAIITRATKDTIKDGQIRLLRTKAEIGCPEPRCSLKAAVVVPLEVLDNTIGTLKFYYSSPRQLNETRVAMAKGLGNLLSTQLGLAELDRQAELTMKAELRALQSQINPHFLFNTINTIASFIRTDPAQARILLREFAVFYRRTLENADDLIALDAELEQTRRYLGFEIARFGDRITVETDIDSRLEDFAVPAFVIQPIVENAVNHGMAPEKPLRVLLTARCEGSDVVISVSDDGVGIAPELLPKLVESVHSSEDTGGLGIALKNVDNRLKGYFGPESGITITSRVGEGTNVQLIMHDAMRERR